MDHPFVHDKLGAILLRQGALSEAGLDSALAGTGTPDVASHDGGPPAESGARLGETLVRSGRVSPERVAEAVAAQYGLPYVELSGFAVPSALFERFPAAAAYRLGAIPYRQEAGCLHVAVSDPGRPFLIETLERICGMRVGLLVSSAEAIAAAMKRSRGPAEVLNDVSRPFRLASGDAGKGAVKASLSLQDRGAAGSPVVDLVNTLLLAALQQRASDIHVEAGEDGVSVKYRVDGVLYPAMDRIAASHHGELVSRLKVMSDLDISEQRVPQDGRFGLNLNGREVDFRVSVLPGVYGEDVVIRILDRSSITENLEQLNLDSLGLAPELVKKFRRSIHEPYGMVLITGPTGSGKTTTLYGALNELNTGMEKIVTIEDPVEYQLRGVVQVPVNEKKNLTFARGLRSILRHDPDKIMIGEIRDPETAQIAVQSALTGHLVFTTVHANNAFDVISRFSHMGVDVHGFVSALNCVMAQRLVRRICPACRAETRHEPAYLEQSGLDPKKHGSRTWYEGRGCDQCFGTGFRGRSAIAEFLDLSLRIRELIGERRSIAELKAVAAAEGMQTLRDSALAKAFAGETTLPEVNRVTFVE